MHHPVRSSISIFLHINSELLLRVSSYCVWLWAMECGGQWKLFEIRQKIWNMNASKSPAPIFIWDAISNAWLWFCFEILKIPLRSLLVYHKMGTTHEESPFVISRSRTHYPKTHFNLQMCQCDSKSPLIGKRICTNNVSFLHKFPHKETIKALLCFAEQPLNWANCGSQWQT